MKKNIYYKGKIYIDCKCVVPIPPPNYILQGMEEADMIEYYDTEAEFEKYISGLVKHDFDYPNYKNGQQMIEGWQFVITNGKAYPIKSNVDESPAPVPSKSISYEDISITIQEMDWHDNIPTKEFLEIIKKIG